MTPQAAEEMITSRSTTDPGAVALAKFEAKGKCVKPESALYPVL